MKEIVWAIKRGYHRHKIQKILSGIANRVFNDEWEKRKGLGITKKQLADAIVASIVAVLNDCDDRGEWSAKMIEENGLRK